MVTKEDIMRGMNEICSKHKERVADYFQGTEYESKDINTLLDIFTRKTYDQCFTDVKLKKLNSEMDFLPVFDFCKGSELETCLKLIREVGKGCEFEVGYSYQPLIHDQKAVCIGSGGIEDFTTAGKYAAYRIFRTYIDDRGDFFITEEFEFYSRDTDEPPNESPDFIFRKQVDSSSVLPSIDLDNSHYDTVFDSDYLGNSPTGNEYHEF